MYHEDCLLDMCSACPIKIAQMDTRKRIRTLWLIFSQ
jgi:hypothetical protein